MPARSQGLGILKRAKCIISPSLQYFEIISCFYHDRCMASILVIAIEIAVNLNAVGLFRLTSRSVKTG